MHIVFAVSNVGLGHATRSLPLINAAVKEGNEVSIFGFGNALALLKKELGDKAKFQEIQDYDIGYKKLGPSAFDIAIRFPGLLRAISAENAHLQKFSKKKKVDRVVADGRYGFFLEGVPSYFISNQLRFKYSRPFDIDGRITEFFNNIQTKKYTGILIPDYEKNSLGGILDHEPNFFDKKKLHYLGIISGVKKEKVAKDIDVFISISGPGESRVDFEKKILECAPMLNGKVVITLGDPSDTRKEKKGRISIFPYLSRKDQDLMLNRAKLIVSRSGYTTLMELAEIEQKAFFVPIPRHFEQEYLAAYHEKLGHFHSNRQDKFDLVNDVKIAKEFKGISGMPKTKESIEKFKQIVL